MQLRGVGKTTEKYLARLNIFSVQDLLFHLPSRYEDRTRRLPIQKMRAGHAVLIEGVIQSVETPLHTRTKLLCELSDETGEIHLRFFHLPVFLKKSLTVGNRLRCFGTARLGPHGLEIIHPEFQVIAKGQFVPTETHLTAIYPTTQGLTQTTLRKLVAEALQKIRQENNATELLPAHLIATHAMPAFIDALHCIHQPPNQTNCQDLLEYKTAWQQRLIFEELLAHRVSLLQAKQLFQTQPSTALKVDSESDNLLTAFRKQLPFSLTNAQERVCQEIGSDLAQQNPMLRLLQGDVGSGKTVVAALAMLRAVQNNQQAALMAPTELLASQHYQVFKRWLQPFQIEVVFLSSAVKTKERKATLAAISANHAKVIIGTHALFQQAVVFSKLALIIIDEQHRFGVHQRALMREKGSTDHFHPHQLIMTATPIPRTLAMSFYADLDCSIIDEMPASKATISTNVLATTRRDEVIARIKENCMQGKQAYWVCPLIDESEAIDAKAAIKAAFELQAAFPTLKVALIHGRLKAAEKEATMQAFQQGLVHVLVATTVIEVGIDVPNASIMVIENAERLGLAQLHQLRGRIGRGTIASHCILLYQPPLSEISTARLSVMRETNDGFKIAERDLALRGPGEVLGERQTGALGWRVADLMRDHHLLEDVKKSAGYMVHNHPELIAPLIKRWIAHSETQVNPDL